MKGTVMATLQEDVTEIILKSCHPSVPQLDDAAKPLLESGLDSLDYATTLMALEEKFCIQIPIEDMDELNSINSIVSYLQSRQG